MTENRRGPGSSRGKRPSRTRQHRNDDLQPVDARPEREPERRPDSYEQDEYHGESDDSRWRREEQEPMRRANADDNAQPPPEEEPFETQPASLGRMADVESQPSDFYAIETHFDDSIGQFTGSILEFPELKAQGSNREVVMADLEAQAGQRLEALRQSGSDLPEPICEKQYPEFLQIALSQSLFRKLDRISRYEKIDLDKLVSELLARAVERRDSSRGSDRRPQQSQVGQHGHRHSNHRHQNRRGGSHSNRGRGYHESLQNKENFMEYVRNLENRGGGNWRKK